MGDFGDPLSEIHCDDISATPLEHDSPIGDLVFVVPLDGF